MLQWSCDWQEHGEANFHFGGKLDLQLAEVIMSEPGFDPQRGHP